MALMVSAMPMPMPFAVRAAAQLVYLEDLMKIYVAMLATAVVVICTGTARADIVTVNAINATGVGKVIGTIACA